MFYCAACLDPVLDETAAFTCGARRNGREAHGLCAECFARFATTCVSYRASGSLPMQCAFGDCKEPVPDAVIRRLLANEPSALAAYDRATVLNALEEAGERVVSCVKCSAFCAVAPPPGDRAADDAKVAPPDDDDDADGGGIEGEPDYVFVGDEVEDGAAVESDGAAAEAVEHAATSFVFECQAEGCNGRQCLGCDAPLDPSDADAAARHVCRSRSAADELADRIHAALAEGSMRRCPECALPGLKDLSCTHIRCDRCDTRWCYACGVAQNVPGAFRNHNSPYTVCAPQGEQKCPIYLKYAYGDDLREVEMRLDGDPRLALRRFHTERQMRLVEELRREVGNEPLWNACVQQNFPDGLFEADDVAYLRRRDAIVASLAALVAERRREAEEAAERRRIQAERLRREAEERAAAAARMRERLSELAAEAQAESQRKIENARAKRREHQRGLRDFLRERRARTRLNHERIRELNRRHAADSASRSRSHSRDAEQQDQSGSASAAASPSAAADE